MVFFPCCAYIAKPPQEPVVLHWRPHGVFIDALFQYWFLSDSRTGTGKKSGIYRNAPVNTDPYPYLQSPMDVVSYPWLPS